MVCTGRKARKEILEAVGQVREFVNVARGEAKAHGKEFSSPDSKHGAVSSSGRDTNDTQDLYEALGIGELSTALAAMKEVMIWQREQGSSISSRHDTSPAQTSSLSARYEAEKQALLQEHASQTARYEHRISNLKDEVLQLEVCASMCRGFLCAHVWSRYPYPRL
jgi:hypothetical protein